MKRLGEVIVGAGIESGDFNGYFTTRGQNQYLGLAVGQIRLSQGVLEGAIPLAIANAGI